MNNVRDTFYTGTQQYICYIYMFMVFDGGDHLHQLLFCVCVCEDCHQVLAHLKHKQFSLQLARYQRANVQKHTFILSHFQTFCPHPHRRSTGGLKCYRCGITDTCTGSKILTLLLTATQWLFARCKTEPQVNFRMSALS